MAQMTLEQLVTQLRAVHGEALRAVVLYGSAASGQHIARRSDYNVLVLLDEIDVATLARDAQIARAWGEAGNPPPLTLTDEEWGASADIFPMEYSDILEQHRVLHGELPLSGITVDRAHLRLQVEQQAMGKLIQLRQGIMAAGGDRKRQLELLSRSLSTFMVLFRAVARLHGERPPADYEPLVARVASLAALDGAPFARVVRHVRAAQPIPDAEVAGVLAGYLEGAQRLVTHIDRS
jgi:hypothetical protein